MSKPIASLSLDLDNKWSYMKTHGDPGWDIYPSYLQTVVPRVLRFLEELDLQITFFIVGKDASLNKNREALASITEAGHRVGNHSFNHEPWLHLYSEQEINDELARAEEAIENVTGQKPVGFRGPGFSLSESTLKILINRGYKYDASTFPTFLGPVARAYYFTNMKRKLSEKEQKQREQLFGSFREGLRPLKPYKWKLSEGELLEIPVTTMPITKLPIHVSYLLYLGAYAPALALQYFRSAVKLCKFTGTQLSLLLHPLDFLSREDTHDLDFFPAMQVPSQQKLELISKALKILEKDFKIVTMEDHADHVLSQSLKRIRPQF